MANRGLCLIVPKSAFHKIAWYVTVSHLSSFYATCFILLRDTHSFLFLSLFFLSHALYLQLTLHVLVVLAGTRSPLQEWISMETNEIRTADPSKDRAVILPENLSIFKNCTSWELMKHFSSVYDPTGIRQR